MGSFVSHLVCSRCGRTHDHRDLHGLCGCGGPLLVEYDDERLRREVHPHDLLQTASMWRYAPLLPFEDRGRIVSLGEGRTPIVRAPRLGAEIGLPSLLVKDDGLNPTGTFKARGASCGITAALERGVRRVALPTAGNAGAAWAAYGAAAGIPVHVVAPADAPPAVVEECRAYGAEVGLVDGLIGDAGRVVAGMAGDGWFDAGTLREPYRIEGKKTLGLEISEDLGWRLPDAVVYPAGGGVGLIGIWRGLQQLRELGWVEGDLPRLCVVQADGCAPIVRLVERAGETFGRTSDAPPLPGLYDLAEDLGAWEDARTLAQGLRVPSPLGGPLTAHAVLATGGAAVAVSDQAILEAMRLVARTTGVLAGPEGAATLAGAARLREEGRLGARDTVVLVNTGTGLKHPELMA